MPGLSRKLAREVQSKTDSWIVVARPWNTTVLIIENIRNLIGLEVLFDGGDEDKTNAPSSSSSASENHIRLIRNEPVECNGEAKVKDA